MTLSLSLHSSQKQRVAEDEAARQAARRAAADAKLEAMRRAAEQATASAAQLGIRPEGTAAGQEQRQQSQERADLIAQQDRELAQVFLQCTSLPRLF